MKITRGEAARLVRENDRLKSQLNAERERRTELEEAVLELAQLYSEQDDALVELADIIVGGE